MYSASTSTRTCSPSASSTAAQVPRWPAFFHRRGRSFLVRRENRNGLPSLSNASSDIRHSSGQHCPAINGGWARDAHGGHRAAASSASIEVLYQVMHLRKALGRFLVKKVSRRERFGAR